MLLEEAKVTARTEGTRSLEGSDKVALEEICACRKGDPVGHGLAKGGGGGLEEVESFGDGCCRGGGEGCD